MKRLSALLFLVFLGSSQGPFHTTTVNGVGGDIAFTDPDKAEVEDGVFATVVDVGLAYEIQEGTTGTNFGFTIPTSSTIDGIVAEIKDKCSGDPQSGVASAGIKSSSGFTSGSAGNTDLDNTLQYHVFGSPTDTWGNSWVAADFNGDNMYWAVNYTPDGAAGTISVDAMRLTIYYTEATSGTKKRVIGYGGGKTKTETLLNGEFQ